MRASVDHAGRLPVRKRSTLEPGRIGLPRSPIVAHTTWLLPSWTQPSVKPASPSPIARGRPARSACGAGAPAMPAASRQVESCPAVGSAGRVRCRAPSDRMPPNVRRILDRVDAWAVLGRVSGVAASPTAFVDAAQRHLATALAGMLQATVGRVPESRSRSPAIAARSTSSAGTRATATLLDRPTLRSAIASIDETLWPPRRRAPRSQDRRSNGPLAAKPSRGSSYPGAPDDPDAARSHRRAARERAQPASSRSTLAALRTLGPCPDLPCRPRVSAAGSGPAGRNGAGWRARRRRTPSSSRTATARRRRARAALRDRAASAARRPTHAARRTAAPRPRHRCGHVR